MGPDRIRVRWGFGGCATSAATLLGTSPALAQNLTSNMVVGAVPLTIALGAGAFALLAVTLLRRVLGDSRADGVRATGQIAHLRALVDEYEALLAGTREITVLWTDGAEGPKVLGMAAAVLPPGQRPEAVLDFPLWLPDGEAQRLAAALEALRVEGRGFDL
ncbi:hypothetical protein, partial [Devosia sp.]|uniref:hypothetical protein n=1 Tax=Devosia sp. TaxID=1871048 RepID=UPI002EECAEB5